MARVTAGATATATKKKPSKPTSNKPTNFATKVSDDAVAKSTGKTWDQWFKLLDKAGCAKMNHKEIVAVVAKHFDGPWWGQMVTVGYEQARGLRELNQSC